MDAHQQANNNRNFIPTSFTLSNWESVAPFYEDLKNRNITSLADLEKWLTNRSELDAFVSENVGWKYIKMNIDTTNEELSKDFHYFINEIEPKIAPINNELNKKFVTSPLLSQLDENTYKIYLRAIKKEMEIFREENVSIQTKLMENSQKYGAIVGSMTINFNNKSLTLQQASNFLKENDRALRQEVYLTISKRKISDKDKLNDLFSEMITLRHKIAQNADFENYRDYMFAELGRFDYTPKDCFEFHESIAKEVVPVINDFDSERKNLLGVETLKPWDKMVDPNGKQPLKPVASEEELIDKTIACFNKIHPYFGECMKTMKEIKHLDLSSKMGKAPGGFNYPLYETGVPFIFMNSVGSQRDVVTMIHEGGHAVHSFLTNELPLTAFKEFPSEVAELASMSMELISMDYWDVFYDNEAELKRAKKEQLQGILNTLPWVATIDKFQHLVYERPNHSLKEREQLWNILMDNFSSDVVDWSDCEEERSYYWQKQLHLFEVPFYYIEYGMAQLGAIAVWRNYKQHPEKALNQYIEALKLGYTKPISEIYTTAGIAFNFSQEYIKELVDFVQLELNKL
ncbi:MAG: oligoendopeptidase F [Flavobacteriales bacterium]|jgi:oligoendopeptidase F|nr:M3 family oligoendopeptidase [Flavobacteriales bacterium]MBQ19559.1 oligoendopeptidase F [Flavobacteriales bacterium]|tara:strand:- start:114318 stop:116033 length:1716 start_codon:yes stop_codon:yes gene_type:complete